MVTVVQIWLKLQTWIGLCIIKGLPTIDRIQWIEKDRAKRVLTMIAEWLERPLVKPSLWVLFPFPYFYRNLLIHFLSL